MKLIKSAFTILATLAGLIVLVAVVIGSQENLAIVSNKVEQWRAGLTVIRLSLIGLAWYYWPSIVVWLMDGKNTAAESYLISRRHFYISLMLAVELLLMQNVLAMGV